MPKNTPGHTLPAIVSPPWNSGRIYRFSVKLVKTKLRSTVAQKPA